MSDEKREGVPLTVEEAKEQIVRAAIEMQSRIIIRHNEALSVHVGNKVFEGLDAYAAKEAVDELVASSDAYSVSHKGENATAYVLHQRLIDRATKDTSD